MSVGRATKDPEAIETFGFDYTNDLATGDTISTSTWAFERHDGMVTTELVEVARANTTVTTSIRLSGGVLGQTYYLRNTIVTANGDTIRRRILLDIEKE